MSRRVWYEPTMRARGFALALVLVCGVPACGASAPRPCQSADACSQGQECLANRCSPAGIAPVHPDARRLVLEPTELSVLSADCEPGDALPGAIAFGRRAGSGTSLYMRFEPRWRGQHLQSAFLLLDPMPDTARTGRDIPVDAWRVREPWQRGMSPLRPAGLAPPRSSAIARAGPALPLRVDVTNIVRWLDEHPRSDHGVALAADGVDEHGASFATGATIGTGPRLELYVR
jgi:hypothetical protein